MGSPAEKASGKTINKIATSICNSYAGYYNGTNAQYHPWEVCYNVLTKKIRVRQNFELVMNTLMCGSVHELMVKYQPDIHCSYIGSTGGEEYDTITYCISRRCRNGLIRDCRDLLAET